MKQRITPVSLEHIKPDQIADLCSRVHIGNVISNHVEMLKIANRLAEEVLTLNPKAGSLGEGKANMLLELAEEFKKCIREENE